MGVGIDFMLQDILSLLYEYDKRLAKGGGGGMNRASYLLYKCEGGG